MTPETGIRIGRGKQYKHSRFTGGKALVKALVLLLVAGCSISTQTGLRRTNQVGAALMATAIACDWGQTHYAAATGWNNGEWFEENPVLGARPSTGRVHAYMTLLLLGSVLVGRALPDWLEPAFYGAMTALEVKAIINNYQWGVPGLCGRGF